MRLACSDGMLEEILDNLQIWDNLRRRQVLGDSWKESIEAFHSKLIPCTLKMTGTGCMYHHMIIAHLYPIE